MRRAGLACFALALVAAPTSASDGLDRAWTNLAASSPAMRSAARLDLARAMLKDGLVREAAGVLAVAARRDAALAGQRSWQALALEAAARSGDIARAQPLAEALGSCPYRVIAADAGGGAAPAAECPPAEHAARPRPVALLYARRAAHALRLAGQPARARPLLPLLWRGDREAQREAMALSAALALPLSPSQRARVAADPVLAADRRLATGEARLSVGQPMAALALAERPDLSGRDAANRPRQLLLQWRAARAAGQLRPALQAASLLMRYEAADPRITPLLPAIAAAGRDDLMAAVGTGDMAQAASLYWDHRDLAPPGPDGRALAMTLARRLEAEGYYERAGLIEQHLAEIATGAETETYRTAAAANLLRRGKAQDAAALLAAAPDTAELPVDLMARRRRLTGLARILSGGAGVPLLADALPALAPPVALQLAWLGGDMPRYAALACGQPAPATDVVLRGLIAATLVGDEGCAAALRTRFGAGLLASPAAPAYRALVDPARADAAAALRALPRSAPPGPAALTDAVLALP
jgi:hypothetical protein